VEKYVQVHDAHKHDFFLIPNGTVHSSGKDNLVLEISATPYIFTFKMYDWVRLDLNGKPRPINIDHAFNNLDFSRKGAKVQEELISKQEVIGRGDNWQLVHAPTHAEHFYDVHRLEFTGTVTVETGGKCHVLMLVEGESVIVETANGFRQRYSYAETFAVPAAAGSYKIFNEGGATAKVVKAFVK
jgi:mannose-6-phosphate isomerase class I